jgi:diguanylate cyclase (GGDEF)-like protein/PAS domain S-box-containing protein
VPALAAGASVGNCAGRLPGFGTVMSEAPISVLVISDDTTHSQCVEEACRTAGEGAEAEETFRVESASRLSSDALDRLHGGGVVVVLLGNLQPGLPGAETLEKVSKVAPLALLLQHQREVDDDRAIHYFVHGGACGEFVNACLDIRWVPDALRSIAGRNTALKALGNSEARFRAISDASPLGIFVADTDGGCVYTNAAYQEISGLTFGRALGTRWSMAIHPQDRERVLADWHAAAHGGEPFRSEFRFRRANGSIVWTRVNSAPMCDGRSVNGHVQTVEDITTRKSTEFGLQAAEQTLFEEKERAQVTLNSIGDAVISTDSLGNVTFLNQVAEKMTGWACQQALGRPLTEVFRIIDGATRKTATNPARSAIENDEIVDLAAGCVLLRRDGAEFPIEDSAAPIHSRDGSVSGAVIVFHDISQSRTMAQKMTHLAHHDFLTGLPNRVLLIERISQAIQLADRHGKQLALLFIDLDNFKRINDSLGHAAGDNLLRFVADRLATCVRTTDTLCRQGGDEFVMLLTEIERPQDAALVADKLRAALAEPYLIGEHDLRVTLSAGISIFPDDGIDADSLMQKADTAMYHAKASGRDGYLFFRPTMNAHAVRRLSVESGLRLALQHGELTLHYQPKVNLASGVVTGSEALVRWQEKSREMVYPEQFVPVAEDCGLIVPIGRWVLREVCRQTVTWITSGLPAVSVAVNLSALEFRHKDFLSSVATILKETGMAPNRLEFEITESVLMHDVEASMKALVGLKVMGIRLAVDDFGTGYSSLNYLRRFPIDTLKVDQSFVRDVTIDINDASIVSAVIGLGRALGKRVIAEGVETREQLAFLKDHHCDEGQGFYFSHPLSAPDFCSLLRTMGGAMPQSQ